MSKLKATLRTWLPFAVAITVFCALTYGTLQQALRQGLNDPQIQMAEDTAHALDNGAAVGSLFAGPKVEISRSLAPFVIIYDGSGQAVAGSAQLNGQLPAYPQGALESARQSGENRVTWQPSAAVRIASVVVPYANGFVVAGRNMREVEGREWQAELLAVAAWVVALLGTIAAIAFGEFFMTGAARALKEPAREY